MPKLGPEEKKALKAQKKLKAEEKKKQLKRDQLERELKYGQTTVRRYEQEWRAMLMRIALPRMRKELQFAWNNFERTIDSKDFIISLLLDELNDAEEQYMMNFRKHIENIGKLIRFFRERVDELKTDCQKQTEELQKHAHEHLSLVNSVTDDSECFIKMMLFGLEQEAKDNDRMIRIEYIARLNEQEARYSDTVHRLRAVLESKHQQLWAQTYEFLKDYNAQIKERKKNHDELKQQDDAVQDLIARQVNKIAKGYVMIKKLRTKFADLQVIGDIKMADLQLERDFFHNAFLDLKQKLEENRKFDATKLRLLTTECHTVIDFLKSIVQKGEFILQEAGVCRKLETLKEKILPFPVDPSKDERSKQQDQIKLELCNPALNLFWQRVAQANALRYAINEERMYLVQQNKIIKAKINEYELFYAGHFTQNAPKRGRPAVTDAAAEVAKYKVHGHPDATFLHNLRK